MTVKKTGLKLAVMLFVVAGLLIVPGFTSILTNTEPEISSIDSTPLTEQQESEITYNLANMKGWFTENRGQIENFGVRFIYAGSSCSIGFVESGYIIELTGRDNLTDVVKVQYTGANQVMPIGQEELAHQRNYFRGNDPSKWQTGVPSYQKVIYEDLYDGIDLVFYTTEQGVKYDFVVSPGADPEQICWSYKGADEVYIDVEEKLHIITSVGELVEEVPFSYQIDDGKSIPVISHYRIVDKKAGFKIGNYDSSLTLVIDPLLYSTYVAGDRAEEARGIKLDSKGNVYVTGYSRSDDFPTTSGCFDDSHSEDGNKPDVFVCKLNSDGTDLIFSTFVGGDNWDEAMSIELDADNNIYVCGYTLSSDFPTTADCFDDSLNGSRDAFAFKLNPDGSDLIYSTHIGGEGTDVGSDIALDSENNTYIVGYTYSSDFPTSPDCYDDSQNETDGFISKLKYDGTSIMYSTFIGGSDTDYIHSIALDAENNVYITGQTHSSDFPTTLGCYDDAYHTDSDVFVCKVSLDGNEEEDMQYSTFIGGDEQESGHSIALDAENNSYVVGQTSSFDFPTTPGCYDDAYNSSGDIFLCKVNPEGSNLVYSTYIGGDKEDAGEELILNSDNDVYLTGYTESPDFPTTWGSFDESYNDGYEAFITKVNWNGSDILYSTFIGGGGWDYGKGIVIDSNENAYITGRTYSSDFPTTSGVYDDSYNASADLFVSKLHLTTPPLVRIESIGPNPAAEGQAVRFIGNATDDEEVLQYAWRIDENEVYNDTEPSFSYADLDKGTYDVYFKAKDNYGLWSDEVSETLTIHKKPTATITSISPKPGITTEEVRFRGYGTDDGSIVQYSWNSSIDGEFHNGSMSSADYSGLSAGTHTIYFRVLDNEGVWSYEATETLVVHDRPTAVIEFITPNPALVGNMIVFQGNGTDDGTIERYLWRSSIDDSIYYGPNSSCSSSELSVGAHTITLEVRDEHNTWSEEVNTTLIVHERPVATIKSISPDPALDTDSVHFEGVGTDDGTVERYVWMSSLDDEIHNDTEANFSTTNLSSGNHTIYFRVQDNRSVWSDVVNTTLIVHTKPTAVIESLTPNPALDTDSILFKGKGTDDGTIETYNWRIVNGTDDEIYNGTTPPTVLPVSTYTICLKVLDNNGVWSDEVSESLVVHKKPTAEITSVSPHPSLDTDTVEFIGEGTDDGAVERYVWTSSIDGELHNDSEANFTSSSLSVGTHTITFKVQDNYGVWSNEATATLTVNASVILNKLPVVTITNPEDGVELKGTVTIKGSASDPDGTVEKVELLVNGEWFLATGTTSWDFQLDTTKLENWEYTINVLAFDGTDYSNDTILNITVNNEKEEENDEDDGEAGFLPGFEIVGFLLIFVNYAFIFRKKRN